MSFETAVHQWRAGLARLEDAPPHQRIAMERVTEHVYAELRRRLGSTFTVDELADLYDAGTSWTLDIAAQVAPAAPWAWDQRIVGDAAFGRYVREAVDYAGGRRMEAPRT